MDLRVARGKLGLRCHAMHPPRTVQWTHLEGAMPVGPLSVPPSNAAVPSAKRGLQAPFGAPAIVVMMPDFTMRMLKHSLSAEAGNT